MLLSLSKTLLKRLLEISLFLFLFLLIIFILATLKLPTEFKLPQKTTIKYNLLLNYKISNSSTHRHTQEHTYTDQDKYVYDPYTHFQRESNMTARINVSLRDYCTNTSSISNCTSRTLFIKMNS